MMRKFTLVVKFSTSLKCERGALEKYQAADPEDLGSRSALYDYVSNDRLRMCGFFVRLYVISA